MKCPICARETDSDAVFCEICGKKIPRCPSCGKVLYERSRFCDHDGAPLPEELFLDLPPDPSDAPPPQKKNGGRSCDGKCEKCMLFDCAHRWDAAM